MNEWIADEIAIRAAVKYGKKHSFNRARMKEFIKTNYSHFCREDFYDPFYSGGHPTNKIRISQIVGQNPHLREFLGCSKGTQNPCSEINWSGEEDQNTDNDETLTDI